MKSLIDLIIKFIYLILIFYIAKEEIKNEKFDKKIVLYGSICSIVYMIYKTILDVSYIYMSTIHLITYIILFVLDTHILRKYAKESYVTSLLTLLNIILIFTGTDIFIKTILIAIVALVLYSLINKMNKKKNIQDKKHTLLPIAFFIGASNLLTILIDAIIKI